MTRLFVVTMETEWELETDRFDDENLPAARAELLVEEDIRNGDLRPSEGRAGWVQRGATVRAQQVEVTDRTSDDR